MYLCPYFYAIKFDWQLVNYVRTDMGWPSFTSLSFYYEPLVFIGSQFHPGVNLRFRVVTAAGFFCVTFSRGRYCAFCGLIGDLC